jgi:hypothetical protein
MKRRRHITLKIRTGAGLRQVQQYGGIKQVSN